MSFSFLNFLEGKDIEGLEKTVAIGIVITFVFFFLINSILLKRKKHRLKHLLNQYTFDKIPTENHLDTNPIAIGKSNTYTIKLDFKNRNKIITRGTYVLKTLYLTIFFIGVNSLFFGYYEYFIVKENPFSIGNALLKFVFTGGLLMMAGILVYLFLTPSKKFDLNKRSLIGNRKINFSEIQGLQIVPKLDVRKSGMYKCYELNVVLKDGKRMNIMQHGDKEMMLHDAFKLKNKLNLPLWKKE